jgi:hypothetical protein
MKGKGSSRIFISEAMPLLSSSSSLLLLLLLLLLPPLSSHLSPAQS